MLHLHLFELDTRQTLIAFGPVSKKAIAVDTIRGRITYTLALGLFLRVSAALLAC